MTMGLVHPGTSRGMLLMMIGSRKTTPPRMFRMVPFGDTHIFFRPNSSTRASSGVIVAHLTPTPCSLMALAASTVTWSSVRSRSSIPRSKYRRSTSRYGWMSRSLMNCQMIRVISSPSSSTTGPATLIFAMGVPTPVRCAACDLLMSRYRLPVDPCQPDAGAAMSCASMVGLHDMTPDTGPVAELDARYSEDGAQPTSWQEARHVLRDARTSWLSTVRPNGRPHVTPLLTVWEEEAPWFCTGAEERKGLNLAANPHCVLTTG